MVELEKVERAITGQGAWVAVLFGSGIVLPMTDKSRVMRPRDATMASTQPRRRNVNDTINIAPLP